MITKILRILYFVLMFVIPYLFLISFYPVIWEKIDKLTWTQFNWYLGDKIDQFITRIWDTKDSTNSAIDWVWTNTKNKTIEQNKKIDEIINQ